MFEKVCVVSAPWECIGLPRIKPVNVGGMVLVAKKEGCELISVKAQGIMLLALPLTCGGQCQSIIYQTDQNISLNSL